MAMIPDDILALLTAVARSADRKGCLRVYTMLLEDVFDDDVIDKACGVGLLERCETLDIYDAIELKLTERGARVVGFEFGDPWWMTFVTRMRVTFGR